MPSVTALSYNCWFKNKACPGAIYIGEKTKIAEEKNFITLIKSKIKKLPALKEAFKIVVEKADTHMNSG